ncbi:coiled-coil-helix-coiled-coil-helix domain-containing protein 1 [Diorhabda sublineata]|uniref:coiled-coil-helix-coiled-coil-helix domain-containing protein 1 n=1 Tax=Diorhabda sublineata TaxID=1163346 RepID=UPI0024E166CE|nr:coiled-coil-helix-coiled-coil-helix domain-containing protein 1 [Diorhabda sublineata]
MKIFSSLFVARPIPKEPVPFKELLPLKLKGAVSGKGGKSSDVCCIYEMSIMFACFKENEFNQAVCSKEIESFKKCYKNHLDAKKLKEEKEAKGVLTPGEKKMSHKQLNALLRKFPNIK